MKKNNKKGFTLVELVIVIAVIAILSAVLIPTFGNVIQRANETQRQQDAMTAYQSFLVDHAEDPVIGNKACILFVGESVNGNTISDVNYAYVMENGSLAEVKGTAGNTVFDQVKSNVGAGNSETIEALNAVETSGIAAKTAYKLNKDGMYIVFAA